MKRLLVTILLGGLVTYLAYLADLLSPRTWWQPIGVEELMPRLESKTFLDMVPDTIVRAATRHAVLTGQVSPAEGRHEVFHQEVCTPLVGYNDEKCFNLLGAYMYTPGGGERWLSQTPVPKDSWGLVTKTRDVIMEKARAFFADPQRLHEFYETKKRVVRREILTGPHIRHENLLASCQNAERYLSGMRQHNSADPELRRLFEKYTTLEKEWDDGLSKGRDDSDAFLAWRVSAYNLQMRLNPKDLTFLAREGFLFAKRRQKEGGPALADQWVAIGDDLFNLVCTDKQ